MDKATVNAQVERFHKGFPWLDVVCAATPGSGIEVLTENEAEDASLYLETARVDGKCKFVPASGAASRMFKDIFAGMQTPNDSTRRLADNLERFAFYDPAVFGKAPFDPARTASLLLTEAGLNYGSKPKGVLKFHRYHDEVRTAIAEHLVEGQAYMRNYDGSVDIVVTISPEHLDLFKETVGDIKEKYEKRYGVRYNIKFVFQDTGSNTIAVDTQNRPFLLEDGSILTRPAGHGALIYNLNKVDEELVSIKNIDNVCVERMLPTTALYKKVLMGKALMLRDRVFGLIAEFDQLTAARVAGNPVGIDLPGYIPSDDPYATEECQSLCNEIEEFLSREFCIELPEFKSCKERALALRAKLDRPLRVCGMVRNEGEPGGGPFIVRGADGSTSLQILESAQINMENPESAAILKSSTHFNPVDLVCCLKDWNGKKFNLPDYVDEDAGLIISKSYKGRELKALELPGLWNGSMSDWNTLFVEVPADTFNPVKIVLDLLRESHQ